MSIWIAGDYHGKVTKFTTKARSKSEILTGDTIIFCGDLGVFRTLP